MPAILKIDLTRPAWLGAVVLAAVPFLISRRAERKGLSAGMFSTVCQCLAIIFAAVALARPALPGADQAEKNWLIIQDVSSSARSQAENVSFDDASSPVVIQRFAANLPADNQQADPTATNISAALRLAISRAEANKLSAVTILTDGRFSDDWQDIARELNKALTRANAILTIIPLDSPPGDARIADFKATRKGDIQEIRLTVAGNSPQLRKLTIRRTAPTAAVLYEQNLNLEPALPVTIRLTDRDVDGSRTSTWLAELSRGDVFPENDSSTASLLPSADRHLAIAPPGANLPSDLPRLSPVDAPNTPAAWSNYSAVVLADPTGQLLSSLQRESLADYVRQGGGLVLIGTGPCQTPTDLHDPLNEVAALITNPFTREPLDLVVILDASGSMAQQASLVNTGQSRFDIAAEAVISLREHLTAHDRLKVITFADEAEIIYDSNQAGPNFAELRVALDGVRPAGPTKIASALGMATARQPDDKKIGMVLVLSDLRTTPFDPSQVAEQFRRQDWKLAAIATGPDTENPTPLETLAVALEAPLVQRENLQGLSKIFGQLCRQARSGIFKNGLFEIQAQPGWPKLSDLQTVRSYIPAVPATGAEIIGTVLPSGDALLAGRQSGLGRSFSLSASPMLADNPQWSAGAGLEHWRALIGQLVSLSARPEIDGRFSVNIYPKKSGGNSKPKETLQVKVLASQAGNSINNLDLRAEFFSLRPDQFASGSCSFNQIAPGEYVAAFTPPAGPVGLRVLFTDNVDNNISTIIVWQGVTGENAQGEFTALGAAYDNLRKLADLTGGELKPALISEEKLTFPISEKSGNSVQKNRQIWPIFLAEALLFMLLGWYKENKTISFQHKVL